MANLLSLIISIYFLNRRTQKLSHRRQINILALEVNDETIVLISGSIKSYCPFRRFHKYQSFYPSECYLQIQ